MAACFPSVTPSMRLLQAAGNSSPTLASSLEGLETRFAAFELEVTNFKEKCEGVHASLHAQVPSSVENMFLTRQCRSRAACFAYLALNTYLYSITPRLQD